MTRKNTWRTLPKEPELDGSGGYTIIDPRGLYRGKSYSEWTCDWFNWFLSADADNRTSGQVVFLRSRGLPNRLIGSNLSDVDGAQANSDSMSSSSNEELSYSASYARAYVNDPNIRIGGDRLKIYQDQAVLVPIIIAYWLRYESNTDLGSMQDFTGLTIDYGDNPPDPRQLTINNKPALTEDDLVREEDLRRHEEETEKLRWPDFRITTPVFTAVVPDVQYGRSIKDFLESPVPPGTYPATVEGYFVMLKFRPGTYWVHSWASAPREIRGPYFSELLYQIEVFEGKKKSLGRTTQWRPSRNERSFSTILQHKERNGDLTQAEANRFKRYFVTTTEGKRGEEKRTGRIPI
jgi:hypothetical protein